MSKIDVALGQGTTGAKLTKIKPAIFFIDPRSKKEYRSVFFDGSTDEARDLCDIENCGSLPELVQPCRCNGYLQEIKSPEEKTTELNISAQDLQVLLDFSKELQEQPNHGAFPYYWCPASEKLETNIHGEGEVKGVSVEGQKIITLQEYAEQGFDDHSEDDPCEYAKFLNRTTVLFFVGKYLKEKEDAWRDYIDFSIDNAEIWTEDWKHSQDNNPSFFFSDVKDYINYNKHHLGRNPHTFGNPVWRMPKMARLMEIIYRLNPQPEESCNPEAYLATRKDDLKG